MNIEFVQGAEQHTSNWGKFYLKGLEKWQVKEDFSENCHDRHHSYQGYVCLDIPEGTLFTIFEQSGSKRGTDEFYFLICSTCSETCEVKAEYGKGRCIGNYQIIAEGIGKVKAPRLMDWWINSPVHILEFALHCAAHIDKRGLKNLPTIDN